MRSIVVSLPVANVGVSAAFFAAMGFGLGPEPSGPQTACVVIDENVRVLLIGQERFRDVINGDSAGVTGEFLTSLSVDSEEEVDKILARAIAAGARPWPIEPEHGVYGGAFRDPDGHLWHIGCDRPGRAPASAAGCDRPALLADSLRPMLHANPERAALVTAGR